jgi:hypothetical protein
MTDKLTFIKEAGFEQVPSGTKRKMALYKCFCGKLKRMCIYNVKSGVSKSCGCVGIEKEETEKNNYQMSFNKDYYEKNYFILNNFIYNSILNFL